MIKVLRFKSNSEYFYFTKRGHKYFSLDDEVDINFDHPFNGEGNPYLSRDFIPKDVYEIIKDKKNIDLHKEVLSRKIGCSRIYYYNGYVFSYKCTGVFYASLSRSIIKHITTHAYSLHVHADRIEINEKFIKLLKKENTSMPKIKVMKFRGNPKDFVYTVRGINFLPLNIEKNKSIELPFYGDGNPYVTKVSIPDNVYNIIIDKPNIYKHKEVMSQKIGCSKLYYYEGYIFSYLANGVFFTKISKKIIKHIISHSYNSQDKIVKLFIEHLEKELKKRRY